jgi:P4 family phage/plasmid primase-like protien
MIQRKKIDPNDVAAARGTEALAAELAAMTAAASPETAPAPDATEKAAPKKTKPAEKAEKNGDDETPRVRPKYLQLAKSFLTKNSLGVAGADCRLKFYQGFFYRYMGNRYERLTPEALGDQLGQYMQYEEGISERVSRSLVENVTYNLRWQCLIPESHPFPCWIDDAGNGTAARNCVATQKGILRLTRNSEGCGVELLPHSQKYFSTNCLPYEYNPDADCPVFRQFFGEVVPDEGMRELLQEFMGLLLIPDMAFEKFLLLVGEGANGKSVFLDVVRSLLGEQNVSFVPMSQFGAEKSWGLVSIIGKLANLDYDADEVANVQEGRFKAVTGGGTIEIDQKFGSQIVHKPTVRMIVATNNPPIFRDRSDAIWRRLLFVPFSQRIPPEKQNLEFKSPHFWLEKGELPGILNFAVEGLKRLYKRGRFVEPKSMLDAKTNYILDIRPERRFLNENYEFTGLPEDRVPSSKIYSDYLDYLKENGHGKGLTNIHFGRQLHKAFPDIVSISFNYDGTKRERCWVGIRKRIEPPPEPGA